MTCVSNRLAEEPDLPVAGVEQREARGGGAGRATGAGAGAAVVNRRRDRGHRRRCRRGGYGYGCGCGGGLPFAKSTREADGSCRGGFLELQCISRKIVHHLVGANGPRIAGQKRAKVMNNLRDCKITVGVFASDFTHCFRERYFLPRVIGAEVKRKLCAI
ncbi:hypothetical protein PUN28_001513 [Cardiocondyla obscurior]|uniref:Uncharacterized protein n=1 Tax=Cardiocondyla obscurior TaxID=286306 RepID=A0AAW2H5G0_9HYME